MEWKKVEGGEKLPRKFLALLKSRLWFDPVMVIEMTLFEGEGVLLWDGSREVRRDDVDWWMEVEMPKGEKEKWEWR